MVYKMGIRSAIIVGLGDHEAPFAPLQPTLELANQTLKKNDDMTKTEQGWVITQENLPKGKVEVQGYTFSYSKADAIKLFIEGSEMTWAQCRKQYGWNVRKAKLTIEIVSNLTKQSETYTKTSKIKSQKNNDTAK